MRIAISGTHCSGKTTLIEDFLAVRGDYLHEPEPYEWLDDAQSDEPTADDFQRQLEISVERLQTHARGTNVIAERSPADFLAYLLALTDLGRESRDCERIASCAELAATGMAHVDLVVIASPDGIDAPEEEDLALRDAMHDRLVDLITTDAYALFANGPRVVEIHGTREERLRQLTAAESRP